MRMIDRRLGLIFCGFVLLFSVALARAVWVQGVRGGELRADARSQQVTTIDVPGERGRVLDRNGKVLAVSEDAATVIATPYQVKDPARASAQLAAVLPVTSTEVEEALSDRESGFAYIAKKVSLSEADAVEKLGIEGISTLPDSRRNYPQGELASQVIGAVNEENQGLTGLEQSYEDTLGGEDGEEEVVHDARGEPIRFETLKDGEQGRRHAADDRRRDPGPRRGGARRGRRALRRQGRDAPSLWTPTPATSWRWPTGRSSTPTTSLTPARTSCRTAPPASPTSPAPPSRRSPSSAALERGPGHARDQLLPALDDPGRRPRDRGVATPGPRSTPHRGPDPRPVLERRRRHDRARGGRQSFDHWIRSSASASRPGSTSRARSRGWCWTSTTTRARRWGTCRSARASA